MNHDNFYREQFIQEMNKIRKMDKFNKATVSPKLDTGGKNQVFVCTQDIDPPITLTYGCKRKKKTAQPVAFGMEPAICWA